MKSTTKGQIHNGSASSTLELLNYDDIKVSQAMELKHFLKPQFTKIITIAINDLTEPTGHWNVPRGSSAVPQKQ